MTTPDTRDPARREQGLRVTSEQVDDVLLWTGPYADPTIENICRDWLDMAAQEGRMRAVLQAAREYHDLCQMWDNAMDARDPGTLDLLDEKIPATRQRLWDALAALTTGGDS